MFKKGGAKFHLAFSSKYQEAGVTVPEILHLGPSSFIRECNKVKKMFVVILIMFCFHDLEAY